MTERRSLRTLLLAAAILLCISCPATADVHDNISQASNFSQIRMIGPENPMYGFKIALENLNESFTANQSEKLEKETDSAALRLKELQQALAANQTAAVNRALDQYWENYNQSEMTLDRLIPGNGVPATDYTNGTTGLSVQNRGIERALANLDQHQAFFYNLTQEYPNNPGLARAYNNSLLREQKFAAKYTGGGSLRGQDAQGTGGAVPQKSENNATTERPSTAINQSARQQNQAGQDHTGMPGTGKATNQGNSMNPAGHGNGTQDTTGKQEHSVGTSGADPGNSPGNADTHDRKNPGQAGHY